jgi:hypothetical protein
MDHSETNCRFEHPGFAALGSPTFRLTKDDRVAALALNIDNLDVVVPLRAVADLFGIRPDSADGHMLHLVEQGLRFVPSLQIGDRLPSEVLTGEASWEPQAYHRKTAAAKLQLQLVAWIGGATDVEGAQITPQMLIVAVEDPAIRPRVEEGLRRAAAQLEIEGGGKAVAQLIEEVAIELSYFEALRDWLLDRVRSMAKRLLRLVQDMSSFAASRRETLVQVVRLAGTAAIDLGQQFDAIDAKTADIIAILQDLERQRDALRPDRDRLYSVFRAWEPILKAWDTLPDTLPKESDGVWKIIDDSYRFLAPRYMSVQEWQSFLAGSEKIERNKTVMTW